MNRGIDIARHWIPFSGPALFNGGIKPTWMPAPTSRSLRLRRIRLHGRARANRLASNSLLECLCS
jgi:aspartate oxidase